MAAAHPLGNGIEDFDGGITKKAIGGDIAEKPIFSVSAVFLAYSSPLFLEFGDESLCCLDCHHAR